MSLIDSTMTVNEVLRRWPAAADVMNRYGLDMCCGVGLSLEVSAASAGADLRQMLGDLEQAAAGKE